MSSSTHLTIDDILKLLPHRYPFVLVDRVIFLEPGKRIEGVKNLSYNEAFFQGHFPEKPIMPGVLMVEALAQLAGILLKKDSENRNKLFFLAGTDNTRFRKFALPGDQLVLEAEHVKSKKSIHVFECLIKVGGTKIMNSNIMIVEGQVDG